MVRGMMWAAVALLVTLTGCSQMYYAGMEQVGIHKRDIMVDRVEAVKSSQQDAQEEFASALERFNALVDVNASDLQSAYDALDDAYDDSKGAAENVSTRINKLEDVSEALFAEWEQEIEEYANPKLKLQSQQKLRETRKKYEKMMGAMRKSEKSLEPVLANFHDNVLLLKHSLNSQAIGALKTEFDTLKTEIRGLIEQMNLSIRESDTFIKALQ